MSSGDFPQYFSFQLGGEIKPGTPQALLRPKLADAAARTCCKATTAHFAGEAAGDAPAKAEKIDLGRWISFRVANRADGVGCSRRKGRGGILTG
ncbi:uncharacterized protein A4U43_C07F4920 [Asparagus officinalis]|uniref:Uncharacterized protein n=1 Tax=Asparagus officinalis TaxID=4686 RepID=A0A5P1ECK2_ASPOF|nr:uncharacterized protein A4U43_C07F4920 [Asparagus officinalis]